MSPTLFRSTALAAPLFTLGVLMGILATITPSSRAADFAVSPMIIEFQRGVRSAEIQVRNLDQQPIRFQIRGTDWSQDASGKNNYTDSKSLIWFPRAIELAPGESRIIRVGVRAMPASKEQAYTVFLTEVPVGEWQGGTKGGAQIRLLLSVSVPVFVPPAKPNPGGAVESAELRGGQLSVVIANGGNRHFSYREAVIIGLDSGGAARFTHKVQGRTLLSGSRQDFTVRVPEDACRQLTELTLTLITSEKPEIKHRLDVSRADCE